MSLHESQSMNGVCVAGPALHGGEDVQVSREGFDRGADGQCGGTQHL